MLLLGSIFSMASSTRTTKLFSALAVGLAVFCLVAGLRMTRWFEVVELKALDHLVRRYAEPANADSNLVLLAIDESSLEAFGRWPWPRDRYGYVVRYLKQAGARAVVFDVMFLSPMRMPRNSISRLPTTCRRQAMCSCRCCSRPSPTTFHRICRPARP